MKKRETTRTDPKDGGGRWWALPLISVGLAILVGIAYGDASADFDHTQDVVLHPSGTEYNALEPQLALDPTQRWLAVAWVHGDGRALLTWATEMPALTGWHPAISIFDISAADPADVACVTDVSVAVDANQIAHVTGVVREPCTFTEYTYTTLRYRTCDLTTGICEGEETVIREPTWQTNHTLGTVDLALDDTGEPHVAFSRQEYAPDGNAQVKYARPEGTALWPLFDLSEDGERAYQPTIAWTRNSLGEGYVHVAWETHEPPPASNPRSNYNGRVRYRRCPDDALDGSGGLACPIAADNPNYTSPYQAHTYPRPDVAARGDDVVLIWNRCLSADVNPPCTDFTLLYQRSATGGWDLSSPLEVGTNAEIDDAHPLYTSTDHEAGGYERFLRPALSLDDAGLPLILWQEKIVDNPEYDIYHYILRAMRATQFTGNTYSWQETGYGDTESYDRRVAPQPAVAYAGGETSPSDFHQVFMQRPGSNSKYGVYYSYFGDYQYVTPTPTATSPWSPTDTPTPTPTSTSNPTPTNTPTPTSTTPTPTGTPPTPTNTATTGPSSTPTPEGDYTVFLPLALRDR